MVPYVSRAAFRDLARTKKLSGPVGLRRWNPCDVVVAKEADVPGAAAAAEGVERRWLKFTISTQRVDRDGDKLAAKGWQLEEYLRNPVVLWDHNSTMLPVAKALRVWSEGDELLAIAEFPTADVNPFGDQVYKNLKGGFLKACSVGYLPKKWNWVETADRPYGIDFEEQDLMEFSICPIPANPDALASEQKSLELPAPAGQKRFLKRELAQLKLNRERLQFNT